MRESLERLFTACDKDASGGLTHNEFSALFSAVDATTRERFGEILYNQADADADGKLTVGEFVAFYAAKFATMDDDAFTQVTAELLKAAEASPAAAPAAA